MSKQVRTIEPHVFIDGAMRPVGYEFEVPDDFKEDWAEDASLPAQAPEPEAKNVPTTFSELRRQDAPTTFTEHMKNNAKKRR